MIQMPFVFLLTLTTVFLSHTHTHETLADIKRVCGGVLLSGIQCQMRDFNKVNCHYFNALCILGATAQFNVLQEKIMTDAKRLICAQGWTFVHAVRERKSSIFWKKAYDHISAYNSHESVDRLAWNILYNQQLYNYDYQLLYRLSYRGLLHTVCGCCTTGWFLMQQTETFVVVVLIWHHIKTVLLF